MKRFSFILRTLLFGWLTAIPQFLAMIYRVRRLRRREGSDREHRGARVPCVPIDDPAFVRPDPLIYAQYYLRSLGLAVTWDNPDIELHLNGVPVASSSLEPGTQYELIARIWNGSFDAPLAALPVHFSYLDFGAGTKSVAIGSTKIDLGVKGGPHHPAFASVPWMTPTIAGHYCIQVRLDPPDDLNWANNLGQENTDAGKVHSPALFTFKLRNEAKRHLRYRFEVDAYRLIPPGPCAERADSAQTRRTRLDRHRAGNFSVPPGWQLQINPTAPLLAPDEEITVEVTITPPDGFVGTQNFNVNAFYEHTLAGGVTLKVESGA